MSVLRGSVLSSGARCVLRRPRLPGLRHYYVVVLPSRQASRGDIDELHALAHRVGRMLARREHGDPECYTLLYNAARTRRCPWPHVHVLLAPSVGAKRRGLLLFQLKHLLRWRRWRWLRWIPTLA